MKKILLLSKKEGETPLETLGRFRLRHRAYRGTKMTYAGRLDPLVSGLLLVLAADAVQEKEKYLGLSKEYAFEILFGFATDTHDILGKINHSGILKNIGIDDIEKNLKFFTGRFQQNYPLYSSKTIKRARRGEKPAASKHLVEVKSLKLIGLRKIAGKKLLPEIEAKIGKVQGDFRQKEILKIWRGALRRRQAEKFFIAELYVKCGSGMYVRQLAHDLGEKMGIPALAYKIKRTKIGKFGKITK